MTGELAFLPAKVPLLFCIELIDEMKLKLRLKLICFDLLTDLSTMKPLDGALRQRGKLGGGGFEALRVLCFF